MKRAIVVDTDNKPLGEHMCQSYDECLEWVNSFITFNSLSRIKGNIASNGIMTVWTEVRK